MGHDSEGSVNWSDLRPGKGMVRPLSCHLSARFQGNNDTASEPLNNFQTIEIIAHELLDKIRVNTTIGWQTTRTSALGHKQTLITRLKKVRFRGQSGPKSPPSQRSANSQKETFGLRIFVGRGAFP